MQRAPLRLPTWAEMYALLPGGPPSPTLGPPPGATLEWTGALWEWPSLRVEPAVPEGTAYFFTADQLVADEVVKGLLPEWVERRYGRAAGWMLRRAFLVLGFVPLAWTAPPVNTVVPEEEYMTTPVTAPRVYPPDGVQLTVRMDHAGQPAVVVLGGRLAGGTAITAPMAETWRDHFWNNARALINTETKITGATLRDTRVAAGAQVDVGAPATNQAGTVTGAKALGSGSTLIKWSTATGGRRGKGRTFIPGLASGAVDLNGRNYTAGHATAVTTFVTAYLAPPAGMPQPAVLSFTFGGAYPITAGALAPIVGLQRRRMRA